MAEEFSWIHLTDLHTGQPFRGTHVDNNVDQFLDDVAQQVKRHNLRPDVVFFTGDLAYSGNFLNPHES